MVMFYLGKGLYMSTFQLLVARESIHTLRQIPEGDPTKFTTIRWCHLDTIQWWMKGATISWDIYYTWLACFDLAATFMPIYSSGSYVNLAMSRGFLNPLIGLYI